MGIFEKASRGRFHGAPLIDRSCSLPVWADTSTDSSTSTAEVREVAADDVISELTDKAIFKIRPAYTATRQAILAEAVVPNYEQG